MDFEIFTICHQCGKLLYVPQSTWELLAQNSEQEERNNESPPKTSFFPPTQLKRNRDVTINYNVDTAKSIKQFQKTSEILTIDKNSFFPLCQDCTITYIQHIQNYRKLFDSANELIDKKFNDIPENVFDIQYQNAISSATNFVNAKIDQSNINKSTIVEYDSKNDNLNNSFANDICIDPFGIDRSNQNCPILTSLSKASSSFCPLLSCFVFKIGYYRHYATINNIRVGFYKYDPNTIAETNFGLYFITHLLYALKTAFNANGIRISLTPYPSISVNNSEFQKLVIPEKKKHTNYDEINYGMQSLFTAFNIINESSFPQRKIATPYEVDTELRTIGSINYDFDWKTVEDWSLAMRFLLHNLKMIQFRAIRSCFYPS